MVILDPECPAPEPEFREFVEFPADATALPPDAFAGFVVGPGLSLLSDFECLRLDRLPIILLNIPREFPCTNSSLMSEILGMALCRA